MFRHFRNHQKCYWFKNSSMNSIIDNVNVRSTTNVKNKLSYVEKVKFFQYLKDDPEKCSTLLPYGKFLVYSGSRPFLETRPIHDLKEQMEARLIWLTYSDLLEFEKQVVTSSVLLDVDENKNPRFSVQLGKLGATSLEKFKKYENCRFFDLRVALFMLDMKSSKILSQSNALLLFHKKNMFCGMCGSKTKRNISGYTRTCSSCNNVLYPASNPVGIVLVTDPKQQNAVLVRQPRYPPGMYTCVAGFSDVGESLEETVKREVAEEVGLEVSHIQYVASQHWPFPGSLMAGCYAIAEKSELSIDTDELEEARWFSREEIGKAIERTEKNPLLMLSSQNNQEFFIPKPGAIAHSLIKHWYNNTPLCEISSKL